MAQTPVVVIDPSQSGLTSIATDKYSYSLSAFTPRPWLFGARGFYLARSMLIASHIMV